MQNTTKKEYWINETLENVENGGKTSIYNIYSPNHYRDKEKFWQTLRENTMEDRDENLIVGGDLNLILKAKEKRGGTFLPDLNKETLEEIMEQCNLLDIPPKNEKYTWDNRRIWKENIKERLDRILIWDRMAAMKKSNKRWKKNGEKIAFTIYTLLITTGTKRHASEH